MPGKDFNIPLMLDYYGNILTEKQREVIDLYYNCDLSLSEISEHAGITRQGVRDSIKRGEATLIEMESKLGLAEKLIGYEKVFEEIFNINERMRDYSNTGHIKPIQELDTIVKKLVKTMEDGER